MQQLKETSCKPHPFSIAAILGDGFQSTHKTTENAITNDRYKQKESATEKEAAVVHERNLDESQRIQAVVLPEFSWLHCSRYNPPKVQSEYTY